MSNKIILARENGYDGNLADSVEKMIGDIKSGDVYKINFRQLDIEPSYFLDVERKYSSNLNFKLEIETTKQQTEDICSKLPEYLKKLKVDNTSFINIEQLGESNGKSDLSYHKHIKYIPSNDMYSIEFCLPENIKRLFHAVALDEEQTAKLEEYCIEIKKQGFYIDERKGGGLLDNSFSKFVRSKSELIDEIGKYENIQLYTISNDIDNSSLWLKINKSDKRDHIELNISALKETPHKGPNLLGSDYLGDLLEVLDVEINPEAKINIEKPGILGQTANRIKRFI